jgi:hypothetical protein
MRTALLFVFSLISSELSLAQSQAITVQSAVLRLGMSESDVTAELARQTSGFLNKNGAVTNQLYTDSGDVADMNHFKLYANLKFNHGKLTYIEKFWRNEDAPDSALLIMNALYGAVSSVAGNGRVCAVRTWTSSEPDEDYKETSIECQLPGATRSVHAFVKTFHYSREMHSVQVNEVLESRL